MSVDQISLSRFFEFKIDDKKNWKNLFLELKNIIQKMVTKIKSKIMKRKNMKKKNRDLKFCSKIIFFFSLFLRKLKDGKNQFIWFDSVMSSFQAHLKNPKWAALV